LAKTTDQQRKKAHKPYDIIKNSSANYIGLQPNLFRQCVDGVRNLKELRPRVVPLTLKEGDGYASLTGQQVAEKLAKATVDDALAVLIHQTKDGKWEWNVVLDTPLILGSPLGEPVESREVAEEQAVSCLGQLGQLVKPAPGYEPVPDPDKKFQIRVNGDAYIVDEWPDDVVRGIVQKYMEHFSETVEEMFATLAYGLVRDNWKDDRAKTVALCILAKCGWTHVTPELVNEYVASHGLDMEAAPAAAA
jgi:hypothetical protein